MVYELYDHLKQNLCVGVMTILNITKENTDYSATNYARYCNKSDKPLECVNSYISLHQQNGMTVKRRMIEMMNMIGFSGTIYRTEYVTVCQPMTRIDTPIVV